MSPMELKQPLWRPPIHVMWARRPTNPHFHISIEGSSTSLQLHQQLPSRFQWKPVPRQKKASTTMTNHAPRMNRTSSLILVELPPNTVSIRHLLVLDVPHVFMWLFVDCLVCFLSVHHYLVLMYDFGLSALKTLWCVNPCVGSFPQMFSLLFIAVPRSTLTTR
jgi:hypothetical protein